MTIHPFTWHCQCADCLHRRRQFQITDAVQLTDAILRRMRETPVTGHDPVRVAVPLLNTPLIKGHTHSLDTVPNGHPHSCPGCTRDAIDFEAELQRDNATSSHG